MGVGAGQQPRHRRGEPGQDPGVDGAELVESAWGAVPGLLSVRFLRPLIEPAVRLSPQRALHGWFRQVWLSAAQGLGIVLPR